MTIQEMRENRAKVWEDAKAFLDAHRQENGTLSAEDDATYEKMENEITNISKAIEREERAESFENVMASATSKPILSRPRKDIEDIKSGTASDDYKKAFWDNIRARAITPELRASLNEGTDSEGGYLVPDEFDNTLVESLADECVFRPVAHVIKTANGVHKIPIVATRGSAAWVDEGEAIAESGETYGQVQLDAHKVATLIKISEELLSDSAFNLQSHFQTEFGRRIGAKEEEAFFVGNGSGKPTGIFNATGGADVGITAASATALTADELIDLFHALRAPYRKKSVWMLNDATIKAIRKLKDGNGQYLWQPALRDGEVSTILGRPYYTSPFVPTLAAGAKAIAFGDFSYYWIGDRQGITFKRLNELYAGNGQVGFIASKRLDGKLVLSEAIKVLQMHA